MVNISWGKKPTIFVLNVPVPVSYKALLHCVENKIGNHVSTSTLETRVLIFNMIKATVCFSKYVQEIDRGLPCLQEVFA